MISMNDVIEGWIMIGVMLIPSLILVLASMLRASRFNETANNPSTLSTWDQQQVEVGAGYYLPQKGIIRGREVM